MVLKFSLATWDHDRVAAIHDGRVVVPGVEIDGHILPTTKLFPIAVQEARFDITERSVSSYVLQVSRGTSAYTAIPAFVSRAFPHNGFFGRVGSGISGPAELAGRNVGVPEYQMTAALWMRGILADEYGVDLSTIRWRTGAPGQGVRRDRLALDLPPGLVVEPVAEGETLQDLLLAGQIDGLLAPNPPAAFLQGNPEIRRLVPDYAEVERDYHRRTGFFPIMHLIGVRKSLVAQNPWLPRALLDAFTAARDLALTRLREVWLGSANRLSLPWLGASMEQTLETMGSNYWPYGFASGRAELAAICRYSRAQNLAARDVTPDELFDRSVLDS